MATADDVRRLALAMPGAREKLSWGSPTFRVDEGKVFAALSEDDSGGVLGVKCPKDDREELIAAEPEKFFLRKGHDENFPWMRVRLSAVADEAELATILADSWRQAAPRALREAHPGLGVPPAG